MGMNIAVMMVMRVMIFGMMSRTACDLGDVRALDAIEERFVEAVEDEEVSVTAEEDLVGFVCFAVPSLGGSVGDGGGCAVDDVVASKVKVVIVMDAKYLGLSRFVVVIMIAVISMRVHQDVAIIAIMVVGIVIVISLIKTIVIPRQTPGTDVMQRNDILVTNHR